MKQLIQRNGSRGIGLIDVLIALVVVAIGVLAIANLQGELFSGSGEVKARNEALELARERIETFRNTATLEIAASDPDPEAFNTLLATPATACAAAFDPEAATNTGWRADGSVTGVNAVFNRWVCIANSPTIDNAREVTMVVAWENMRGEPDMVTLNTLVAYHDPATTLELEAPADEGGLTPSPNVAGLEGQRDDSDFDPDTFGDELDPDGDGDGLGRVPQQVGDNLWTRYTSYGMRELVRLNSDNEYEVVLTSYGGTIHKIQGVSQYQLGGSRKEVWEQSYNTMPTSANNYRPLYTCNPSSNILCALRVQATTPAYCVYPDAYHKIPPEGEGPTTHFGTEDMKCAVGDDHCAIYTCYVPGDCTRTSGTDEELAALNCPTNDEIAQLRTTLQNLFGQDHANGGWYGRVGMILAQENTHLTTNQGAVICVDSGQGLTDQRPSRYYVASRVNPKDDSAVADPANLCRHAETTNVNVCVNNQGNEIECPSNNPVFKERRLCDEGTAYQIAAHEGSNTPVQCHNFLLAARSNQATCNIVATATDRYLRGDHAVRPLFDDEANTVLPTNTEFCHRFEIAGTGVMHVIGDIDSTGWRGTQTGLNVNIDGQTCLTDLGTRFTLANQTTVNDFMGMAAKRYTFNYLCRKGVISWTGRLAVELDAISLNFGEAICDQNVFNGENLTSQRDNPYEYNFPNVVCNYQEAGFETTRTVTVNAGEGGTVELVPESGTVEQGEAVSIIFTPDEGYEYNVTTSCNGDFVGDTYVIAALNNDCTMTVSFWDPDDVVFYTVSATTTSSGGTIDPASREVAGGQSTTFTVTPESGYFASVSGCGGSLTGNTYTTGVISGDCPVTASFAQSTGTIKVNVTANVPAKQYITTATMTNGTCTTFAQNNSTAHTGVCTYEGVVPWSGTITVHGTRNNNPDCHGSSGALNLAAGIHTQTITCVAGAPLVHTVTASAGIGGTISPTTAQVTDGETTTLTLSPTSGYEIDLVDGCGGNWVSGNSYTTGIIDGDCSVSVTFTPINYTVTATAGTGGGISPSSVSVGAGESTIFTVTPNGGYEIDSVTGCNGSLSGSTYTTGAISANCSVEATFREPTVSYTVTATAGTGGGISPSSAGVPPGGSTSFTVTPGSGYEIDSVTGCSGSLSGNTYTTGIVNANCTVNASFRESTVTSFIVTVSAGTGGTVSPSGSVSVDAGQTQGFTITPNTGSQISSVVGCGGSWTTGSGSYTTGVINSDCTVTIGFTTMSYMVSTSAGTGGSISPTSALVSHNGSASFTINPATGYQIDSVSGCPNGILSGNSYTTSQVTDDCTVTASFAQSTGTVSVVVSVTVPGTANDTLAMTMSNSGSCTAPTHSGTTVSSTCSYTGTVPWSGAIEFTGDRTAGNPNQRWTCTVSSGATSYNAGTHTLSMSCQ